MSGEGFTDGSCALERGPSLRVAAESQLGPAELGIPVVPSLGERVLSGDEPIAAIETGACARLARAGLVPDYAVLRRADDLGPAEGVSAAGLVALVAARAGRTRLIDNLAIGD